MKVSELNLESSAIDFLKSEGLTELYPPQADCVREGLFDDKKNFWDHIPHGHIRIEGTRETPKYTCQWGCTELCPPFFLEKIQYVLRTVY